MKLFIDDSEIEEMKIEDTLNSSDNGIVHAREIKGNRGNVVSELQKEFAAIDTIEATTRKSAAINDVSAMSASDYSNGKYVEPETKTNILNHKYQIQDKATTKLMETLNLFNPNAIEKHKDLVAAAAQLSSIVERVSGKESSGQSVHLHLYNPTQKKMNSYDVIDV